ncbi:MAG: PEGA domain-containing protein [Acidobacteriota bacterium]
MNRLATFIAIAAAVLVAVGLLVFRATRSGEPAPAPTLERSAAPSASAVARPPATPAPSAESASPPPRGRAPRAAAPAADPALLSAEVSPTRGTLRIVSDVDGAQVFLDRQFIGTSPATAHDVAPGSHQLNVSAPGYDSHVETIEVTPGAREISVAFRVVRLDLSLDVVHKHRFGSCRGRLTATPRGLRYDTTDKDDAFSMGLLELDTFQMDYLEKNLRVQTRKGKRYDFTDPDGNADRLFVFHRDVERAREQLQKGHAPGE